MTKRNKGLIGVTVIAIILVGYFFINSLVDVSAVTNSGKKVTSCTNADSLMKYYGIGYKYNGNKVVFSTKKGEFRVTSITGANELTNVFVKGADGFYTVNGNAGVLKPGSDLTLIRKSNEAGEIKISFALSKTDSTTKCLSKTEYDKQKAAKTKKTIYTFNTGAFEVNLPNLSSTESATENKTYDNICRAVREGVDPTRQVNEDILKMFENTADAKAYYQSIVPSCFQRASVLNYTVDEIRPMIETALSAWNVTSSSQIGDKPEDDMIVATDITTGIATNKSWSFKFKEVVEKAKKAGHSYYADANQGDKLPGKSGDFYTLKETTDFLGKSYKQGKPVVRGSNESFSMKCRATANSEKDFSNLVEYKTNGEYNIDANAQYYYAVNQFDKEVTYTWNYTKGNKATKKQKHPSAIVCRRVCEEAVEVNYGPPVASKAGLCFEYQVQVTSRIKCKTHINKNARPKMPEICSPIPYCNSVPGYVHQAGSNEEFDQCIKSCDGGKYSEKCSNKCYNKVYNKTEKQAASKNTNPQVKKLGSGMWDGSYVWDNGKIKWSGTGYARYYKEREYGRTKRDHGKYIPKHGFKTHRYSNGALCSDSCYFANNGCKQNKYLNREEAKADYKENLKIYHQAIEECRAAATCTTKTAEFTISAKYTNGSGEHTINYPYTTGIEKINTSKDKDVCDGPDVKDNENIILAYGGCYSNCGKGLSYHTRWSFPGSYLNKKTGELSYKPVTDEGWTHRKGKFCLPIDVKDVNVKWWNYYYSFYNTKHTTSLSDKASSAFGKCEKPSAKSFDVKKDVDWNIKAKTTKFGYFGWNFEIECFYASNINSNMTANYSEECNPGGGQTKTTKKESLGDAASNYTIRTFDLENPFQEGKAIPFNFSKYAEVSEAKNADYLSSPSVYTENLKRLGYKAYSNDNLDYYFELSKDQMNRIKNRSKGEKNAYTKFNSGDMITKHGMYSYRSKAIRENGDFYSSKSIISTEDTIGCNNIKNRSECDKSMHQKGGK